MKTPLVKPQAAPEAAVAEQVPLVVLQNNALVGEPQSELVVHAFPATRAAHEPLVQLLLAHSPLTVHEAPAFLYLMAHLLALQNWL